MLTTALIIGGGPAGMASAIALSQAGLRCEIVELSPDWRPGGIGIALQSAPLRAAKKLGLFEALLGVGRRHDVIEMCGADGTRFAEAPQPNVNEPGDPPFLGMARESLHQVMAAEVARWAVPVQLGVTASSIDGGDVVFTDGRTAHYDLVVGADGAHSATRAAVLPDAPALAFSGQVIWRAEVQTPASVERYMMLIDGPVRLGLVPLPDGRLYMWMLDSTIGPERPARDDMLSLFHERITRFGGPAPEIAAQLTSVDDIDFRALQWLIVPPPWSAGRTILVGDAVHATTPHMAYGAGLALEDAVVLGELAAAGLDFDELAQNFTARRYERARMVVENSLQLSRWEQEPGAPKPEAGQLVGATLGAMAAPL